jgi:hypothetical protein
MAAFLSSFILFLSALFALSGLDMDVVIDSVVESNQQSIVFTANKDMSIVNVPYECVVDFNLPDPFANCDRGKRWLKIGLLK